jgi:hypothetical protein
MSNQAYLVASKNSIPAGPTSDGNTNYDVGKEVIAEGGSYQLPIFWLSLYSDSDLCVHQLDDYRVPTLVCDRATALNNLQIRRESVLTTFPDFAVHWKV